MSKAEATNERKDRIVRATVECMSKFGYQNFSMQDVARTAGVSKGIIHYYFLNKDELMLSVLQRVSGDIEATLTDRIKEIKDPIKKLRIFIEICFDVVANTREYYQVSMDFWTQINQKKTVQEIISAHYRKFRESAKAILDEGVAQKKFKPIDTEVFASMIIGVVDGTSLQWLFDHEVFPFTKAKDLATSFLMDQICL